MHAWCSYCQRYLGERQPYSDHQITHGLCNRCHEEGRYETGVSPRISEIARFFRSLLAPELAPAEIIERGFALGVRPLDLLIGILQPILDDVGRRWAAGELTPAQEEQFTRRCTDVVEELERRRPPSSGTRGTLLMMNAQWNRHVLGARVAAFWLAEIGYTVTMCTPTPPLSELRAVIEHHHPDTIGVSLATEWQMPFLRSLLTIVAVLPWQPRVLVGGAAVRAGCELPLGIERLDFAAES